MSPDPSPFMTAFRGYLENMLRWEQFDALCATLLQQAGHGWYIYAVGEEVPGSPSDAGAVAHFLREIGELLRREHTEEYCGIVYVDNPAAPTLVKIYDPNNLGSSCGSGSRPPPLPGWVISAMPPVDLSAALPLPAGRRRWWKRLTGG